MLRLLLPVLILALGSSDLLAQQRNLVVSSPSEQRIALVIGNDSYAHVSKLQNARADARAMATALEAVGFKVTLRTDANEKTMREAARAFKRQLSGGDVAVFFFSGHGVQLGSTNYLLPVDISSEDEDQVRDESLPLQRVLDDLEEQKAKFSLAIIDACRDNPFRSKGRAIGGRGLAPTTAATGQMIIYSAGAGQQALDRLGDSDTNPNGVFTRIFLREMERPGVSVDRVLRNVRDEVVRLTKAAGHEQVPALYDQAVGDFYFRPPAGDPHGPVSGAQAQPGPADPAVNDRFFWESVKDSDRVEDLKAYLEKFPEGLFSNLARTRLKSKEAGQPADKARAQEQFELGIKYLYGQGGFARNEVEAARLFRLAADQGNALAQGNLALMYANGRGGLPKDDVEAVRLYRLAADQGDARGQSNLGFMYETGRGGLARNDAEAMRLYRLAASQGLAGAQVNLGLMYASGRGGQPKDDVEAVRLYRLAADQGNAPGQANLGLMYANGRGGLAKNEVEALRLFRLAVNQGNALAQASLGFMYATGRSGLTKDEVEAVRLYRLAADQGNAYAQANLGVMYANGRGGLPKDDVEAARLYRLSANHGEALGQANLGLMYATGRGGLPKDEAEAARAFRFAANQGNASAQANLGFMYANGRGGLNKDEVEAVRLYRLAADQGNAYAQANLGLMYEYGRGGLARNIEAAVSWYRLAARQNLPQAIAALKRLGTK